MESKDKKLIRIIESFQKKDNTDDILGNDDIVNILIVISQEKEASGLKYTASTIAPNIKELVSNPLYEYSYDSCMDAGSKLVNKFMTKYPNYRWIEDNSELLNGKLA